MTTSLWMDRFGGFASATCAAHCLIMGFAPALISVIGLEFLANEVYEWAFFASAIAFAAAAALVGFRVHRTPWVLAGFGLGMMVLIAGRMGEALELYEGAGIVAILGGVLLVGAHVSSTLRTRSCQAECAT